jgi:cytidyltransferase-like protein
VERKLGAGVRVLYAGGFDLFHAAHVAALQAAKQIAGPAGTLMVAVNSDAFMAHYKRKPMHTDRKRILDVQDSGLADEVFIWNGPEGQAEQILAATPDVYIAGTDWLAKDLAQQLQLPNLAWFDNNAISLLYLRRTPGISTTQLIAERGHQ